MFIESVDILQETCMVFYTKSYNNKQN